MDGTAFITRIRRALKDVQSDTVSGSFWTDTEILLALNAAQDIFINACLRSRTVSLLKSLVAKQDYLTTDAVKALPADYLHYITATVGDPEEGERRFAQMYLGAVGSSYLDVRHDALIILGTTVTILNAGNPETKGVLHYWRRPSRISVASEGLSDRATIDFEPWIYAEFIVKQAVVILGMKEPQTQREFKTARRVAASQSITPQGGIHLPVSEETPNEERRATGGEPSGQQQQR